MNPDLHRIAGVALASVLLCIATGSRAETSAAPLLPRFPDFGQLPPPGMYQSRIFKLSQDFPQAKPETEPAVQNILQIDYTKDWKKYMEAVRAYIYEGNIEGGSYMIGKVWRDAENPTTTVMQSEGFPIGTVVAKLLFTTAPVGEVPFLTNPIEWLAYTTKEFMPVTSPRVMSTVRFIQMDIMVRDPRAKETGGWVFGTFVYNGALANPNLWLNAVPVGIMWGNDPEVTSFSDSNPRPTKTVINPELKHTIINTSADLPPMHLGWGLRLNGPVDNTMSSCQSCHATAQFPQITPILASMSTKDGKPLTPSDPEWMRWFRRGGRKGGVPLAHERHGPGEREQGICERDQHHRLGRRQGPLERPGRGHAVHSAPLNAAPEPRRAG